MAFKRKLTEEPVVKEHFQGGAGHLDIYPILNGPDEMYHKGRVCSIMKLQPGCEIARHRHEGDGEVFYVLSGHGQYLLDGQYVPVEPGDVLFVDDGEEHAMRNDDDTEDLVCVAVVLYSK